MFRRLIALYFLSACLALGAAGLPAHSQDCNGLNTPDASELDCNANGKPDACDIAADASRDWVADGVPDECGQDCNLNCIADAVDVAPGAFMDTSPQIMPFNDGNTPRTHTIPAPPPATSAVTLGFTTYRDLVNLLRVEVRLNGTLIGNVFTDNGLPAGCRTGTAQLTLSAEQFNALVAGQDAEIRMQPVAGAWAVCSGTYIRVTTTYSVAPHSADCDVNADGFLDGLDIAGFAARALGD